MGERAQHLADRPRGRPHTFPNATVIDRNAGQHETGVAQPGKVGGDQLTPLLALAALRSEVGGYRLQVFVNSTGIHRSPPVAQFSLWLALRADRTVVWHCDKGRPFTLCLPQWPVAIGSLRLR